MKTLKSHGLSETDKRNLRISALMSAAACFMLFLFAPLDLYFSNKDEFFFDLYMILPVLVIMFVLSFALSMMMFAVFSIIGKWHIAAVIYFVFFICSYIQGNYMTGYLPHFKGARINWNDYGIHRIICIVMYLVVTLIVIFVLRRMGEATFGRLIQYASVFLMAVMVITLVTSGIMRNGFVRKDICSSTPTTDGLFTYSEDANFLVFLIDKVDAKAVDELIDEDDSYSDVFNDFTFYTNAEAGYPYTKHSIPLILTGKWYEKQSDFDEYFNKAFDESEFFKKLIDEDFSMGLYETDISLNGSNAGVFDNMADTARKLSSWKDFVVYEIMMVGYRYAPFDLKRFCYMYTNPFNSLKVISEDSELYSDDDLSILGYLNTKEPVKTEKPTYRFIHIAGAHEWFYDENVNLVENGTYEDAVKASLKLTGMYLDIYRNRVPKDVYDKSVIIVMADHGALDPKQQNPVLMIKGFNEHHEMYRNDAPISYDDLQSAYMKLLDGSAGDAVFDYKEGDTRKRRLLFQDDDDNPDEIMEEYIQEGHAGDIDTLVMIRSF